MNKFFKGGIICGIVAILLVMTVAACSGKAKYDPESDFEVEPINGGKGVIITGYWGDKWEVNIPAKIRDLPVTSIGPGAFKYSKLISVTIPNSVTSIRERAFADNPITRITIGSDVTLGSTSGYSSYIEIIGVYWHEQFLEAGFTKFYNNNGKLAGTYTRPDEKSIAWTRTTKDPKSDFEVEPTDDGKTLEIVGYTGSGGKVRIPQKNKNLPVTSIGDSAFSFSQLTSVTIPKSVTSIGDFAFSINELTSVTIPNSVTSIGVYAFFGNQLTSVTIPNSVTSIGDGAFSGGNQLTSVTIGASVTLSDEIISNFDIERKIWVGSGFTDFYNNNGKAAGTYTRPDAESTAWTKK
jgi:hypothetical protein